MTKCPTCHIGRVPADGTCRYCPRITARVTPGRVPLDAPLRRYIATVLVVDIAVYGVRAVVLMLKYGALTAAQNGDSSAVSQYHTYDRLLTIDWWALVASSFLIIPVLRNLTDAAAANGMTRPDIGVGGLYAMPGGRAFIRWPFAQAVCILAICAMGLVHTHSFTGAKAWIVVAIVLCAATMITTVGKVFAAKQATEQLMRRMERSRPAEPAAASASAST